MVVRTACHQGFAELYETRLLITDNIDVNRVLCQRSQEQAIVCIRGAADDALNNMSLSSLSYPEQ